MVLILPREPQSRWSESPQFLTQSSFSLQKCSTLSLSSAPSSPRLRISPWIVSESTLMRSWWWTSCCSSTICSKMTERSLSSSCWHQCHLSPLRLWHWQSTTRLWTALHSTPDLWTLSTSTVLCLTLWTPPCHVTVRTGWQLRAHFSRKKSRTSSRTRAPNAPSDTRAQKGGSTSCSQRGLLMCSSATTPTAKPSNSSGNIARASGCKRPAAASHLHGKTVLWSLSLPGNACKYPCFIPHCLASDYCLVILPHFVNIQLVMASGFCQHSESTLFVFLQEFFLTLLPVSGHLDAWFVISSLIIYEQSSACLCVC